MSLHTFLSLWHPNLICPFFFLLFFFSLLLWFFHCLRSRVLECYILPNQETLINCLLPLPRVWLNLKSSKQLIIHTQVVWYGPYDFSFTFHAYLLLKYFILYNIMNEYNILQLLKKFNILQYIVSKIILENLISCI